MDLLSEEAQVVARCQGGNNAGHTVIGEIVDELPVRQPIEC